MISDDLKQLDELKEYIEKHLRECYESDKNTRVPKLWRQGYNTALWHILSKIDNNRYRKLLFELEGLFESGEGLDERVLGEAGVRP
ncbi:MAG: hypothetical protein GH150_04720 [Hadesarchaea archaeon]|nr:hypothetical protein [Hadesarchaea archaeon]